MRSAFTIVAKNYLSMAAVLATSFRKYNNLDFFIFVLDDDDKDIPDSPNLYSILRPIDLNLDHNELAKMRMIYSVMEFATAVKPFVLEALFNNDYKSVLYFDPDIEVFDNVNEIYETVENGNIFLTPHSTVPMPRKQENPSEYDIMVSGIYNLGFIGVPSIRLDFLKFWQERLRRDCISDIENALFVDQKWIDFVPGMYPTHISHETCYNVAYWNLNQRDLEFQDGKYLVDGKPLKFFHFSGYNPLKPYILSKYQSFNPLKPISRNSTLKQICDSYKEKLIESNFLVTSKEEYKFDRTPSGIKLSEPIRRLYRYELLRSENPEINLKEPPNPFIDKEETFISWLNKPATYFSAGKYASSTSGGRLKAIETLLGNGRASESLVLLLRKLKASTRRLRQDSPTTTPQTNLYDDLVPSVYHKTLWQLREDLMAVFPDPCNTDKVAFLDWLANYGTSEGVPVELTSGVKKTSQLKTFDPQTKKEISIAPSFWATCPVEDFGVNLFGFFSSESGTGEEARNLLKAVDVAQIRYSAYESIATVSRKSIPFSSWGESLKNFKTNLLTINADILDTFANDAGSALFNNHKNISLCAWEVEGFPSSQEKKLHLLDEIWACSTFAKESIANATSKEVYAFSLPVELPTNIEPFHREIYGIPENNFVFLFCFDFLSVFERKNPLGLIEAYVKAFKEDENVSLVLKCVNSKIMPQHAREVFEETLKRRDIFVIDQYLNSDKLHSLLNGVDAYISLHRAEGFGLTIAESMALGKPTIATQYSGNLDFMNQQNSFLVPFTKVKIPDSAIPYNGCGKWANPNTDDASDIMRLVASMSSEVTKRAAKGKSDILTLHNPQSKQEFLKKRLLS